MARTKATLETISLKTGYSITTVSRVLNGKASQFRISKEAEKAIREEARISGFIPNRLAQNLRSQRTQTLGLIVPTLDNSFFASLANDVIEESKSKGYMTLLASSFEDERLERVSVQHLLSQSVEGIMIVPVGADSFFASDIHKRVPLLLIDRYYPDNESLPCVVTDNYMGGCMAVQHLVDNGHRRIACIQGPENASTVRERISGYRNILSRNGIEDYVSISGDAFTVENGYLEAKILISGPNPPTAIFALSNTILLGVIQAVHEAGLSIPDDISVIAFDDNFYMDFLSPAITRIEQPTKELGKYAARQIIKEISGEDSRIRRLKLAPKLVLGKSVKNISKQ